MGSPRDDEQEHVVRAFKKIGVREDALVRKMFRKKPRFTMRLLAAVQLASADTFKTTKGDFAAWGLKNSSLVDFARFNSNGEPTYEQDARAAKRMFDDSSLPCSNCGQLAICDTDGWCPGCIAEVVKRRRLKWAHLDGDIDEDDD